MTGEARRIGGRDAMPGRAALFRPASNAVPSTPLPAWLLLAALAITLAYGILVGHRPILYIPGADYDDELFTSMAMRLASGHWLGAYKVTTLIKGIGFPVFLAINYCVGLPVNTGLCLTYAAASGYFCFVARPLIRSDGMVLALFALLLFIPPLSSSATTRLDRDFFYAAAVLGLIAATINLFWRSAPRSALAAGIVAGGLGGWVWLTREEGVWLLPTLMLLGVAGWFGRAERAPRDVVGPAVALVVTALLVTGVGIINRIVYGSFIVNETTAAPLQGAMTMLEKAAYPDWKPYIPVPAAARMRLYKESPSFRRLRPFLDPEGGGSVWVQSGCGEIPAACEDLAGGWFIWALRDAAANAGLAANPRQAAQFFQRVTAEVSQACDQGRLTCARWLLPLVPPFTP